MVLTQIPRGEHFGDSITRWIGPEGGDSDTFTMTGWDRACDTITNRSRLPRNAHFWPQIYLAVAQILKSTDFVRTRPLPLRRSLFDTLTRWVAAL